MELIPRTEQGANVVELKGRLDTNSYQKFDKSSAELLNTTKGNLILDLSGLEYISSAGLRSLLVLAKSAGAAGRKMVLCSLEPRVEDVFYLAGFATVFVICPTLKAAMSAING